MCTAHLYGKRKATAHVAVAVTGRLSVRLNAVYVKTSGMRNALRHAYSIGALRGLPGLTETAQLQHKFHVTQPDFHAGLSVLTSKLSYKLAPPSIIKALS